MVARTRPALPGGSLVVRNTSDRSRPLSAMARPTWSSFLYMVAVSMCR